MARLVLHVGHGKTGSSLLQSSLSLSVGPLADHGLIYPEHGMMEAARRGGVSSGNTMMESFLDDLEQNRQALSKDQGLFFSNEHLALYLSKNEEAARFIDERFSDVTIILFVRDPVDLLQSMYVQGVKRHGEVASLETISEEFDFFENLERLIIRIEDHGWQLVVRNYSRCRAELLSSFENALGLPKGVLVAPPQDTVNRSLSRGERALQMAFNRHYGTHSSRFISDALCNQLPDVKADPPQMGRAALAAFHDRVQPLVQRINARLPADEKLLWDLRDADHSDPADDALTFSEAQLDLLAREMSQLIFQPELGARVFELVRKIRPGHRLSKDETLLLWELGLSLKPNAQGLRARLTRHGVLKGED